MSRTDKDRPWGVRVDDTTQAGYVRHDHLRPQWRYLGKDAAGRECWLRWAEVAPCDYRPDGGRLTLKHPEEEPHCTRILRWSRESYSDSRRDRVQIERQFRQLNRNTLRQLVAGDDDASARFLCHPREFVSVR